MTRSPLAGTAIGLDVGTVRVGVAATDPTGTIASPVATLPRRDADTMWQRIAEEASRRGATRIVVGLPRLLGGSEGDAALQARRFAEEASRRTGLAVELWDEWLTTVQAERSLIAVGVRRHRRRQVVDAVAAAVMLQAWLDARSVAKATPT